jgi:DNA-binding Lrp family transcriptional regulator
MTSGIDQVNAKILKELLKDGRKTFVEIAKECNTSKDVIAKRYKQLKKQGVIVGATIQNSCACYGCSFVANILVSVQPGNLDYVMELIGKIPQVLNLYPRVLNQSINVMVTLKKIDELEQVKQSIKRLPFILDVDINMWIGARNTPENLSVLNVPDPPVTEAAHKNGKEQNQPDKKVNIKIDEIDTHIIEALAQNGRRPFEKIAKTLNISVDTVVRRYERLKQNRDLRVLIQINPPKIGYSAYALFNLSFTHEALDEKVEALTRDLDVNFIIKTSGKFDITLSLMVKDIKQLLAFQEQIASFSGLTKMEVDVEKIFTVWPMPREFISTF